MNILDLELKISINRILKLLFKFLEFMQNDNYIFIRFTIYTIILNYILQKFLSKDYKILISKRLNIYWIFLSLIVFYSIYLSSNYWYNVLDKITIYLYFKNIIYPIVEYYELNKIALPLIGTLLRYNFEKLRHETDYFYFFLNFFDITIMIVRFMFFYLLTAYNLRSSIELLIYCYLFEIVKYIDIRTQNHN